MREGEFWSPDGAEVRNQEMLDRVHHLVDLFSKIPRGTISLSEALMISTAMLIYKSENVNLRKKMTMDKFLEECTLSPRPAVKSQVSTIVISGQLNPHTCFHISLPVGSNDRGGLNVSEDASAITSLLLPCITPRSLED